MTQRDRVARAIFDAVRDDRRFGAGKLWDAMFGPDREPYYKMADAAARQIDQDGGLASE